MKILVCCHEYPPHGSGIANIAYHLTKSMRKQGHIVDVCSPSRTKYEIKKAQKLIEKIGGFGIIYYWYKTGKLLKILKKKYDIIYAHNPLFIHRIKGKKAKKIRCIVHTVYYYVFKEYGYKNLLSWPYFIVMSLFEKISYLNMRNFKFIVTSPKTIEELRAFRIKNKITVMVNGHEFKGKKLIKHPSIKLNKKKKNLLFVGRLNSQKNLFRLLDTFKEINKIKKNYTLTIIGDGELKKKLVSYTKKKNIKNVTFTGQIEHEKLLNLYHLFDFFISSSHYEGFPATLSEAMGEGLPPLLSSIPIFRFIQKKIETGLITDFKNPVRASKEIISYCSKVNLKKESSALSYKAKNLFNWDKIAVQYLNLEKKA